MKAQILEHPALSQKKQRAGLASALEATEEMLVMARAGKWDTVKDLEIQRRVHLDECLSKPVEDKDLQLFSDVLGMLLVLNDKLVSYVHDTREEYDQKRQNTRKSVSQMSHYLDI